MKPRLVLLFVLLAALALGDDPSPPPSGQVVLTWDLADLTHTEAFHLQGRRARFRVSLDSLPEQRGRYTVYDCASADETLRTVWLVRGQQVEDDMNVEAVLRLRYVEAGQGFDGFWEYRLTDARRCR